MLKVLAFHSLSHGLSSGAGAIASVEYVMMAVNIDARLFVGSVRKAMMVMEAFNEREPSMTLTRIGDKTGLGLSATQRFVYTLETLGYLQREPDTLEYSLSNRALLFVRSVLTANTAIDRSLPLMLDLAEVTGETVSWVEYDDGEVVVLGHAPSPNRAAIVLPIGARFDALTASSGHIFLAEKPRDLICDLYESADESVLSRLGDMGVEAYIDMITRDKARGYAMTEKDIDISSLSVSAPIRDMSNRVVAAINVSVLRARVGREEVEARIVPKLLEVARRASANILSR